MSFKRINNITGWAICFIACMVYLLTMEATGSFWDCGEFASSAYKLQIPHPPGAPLFILLGRIFMIPFSNPDSAILGLNSMSALMSGFTILFLFWSITHFARKIYERNNADALTSNQVFSIMAAGVVGALAYTFSDSFWYSAVESEVYASSSFFTAIVFWAVLKWEHDVTAEQLNGIKGYFTRADRWLILIFYLIGLAVGVHLLNILTIPAIVMVYYFKRYTVTKWGTFWAFVIGCLVTGTVQVPMIQWTIKNAGNFDIFFVNEMGLPFFTGFVFFFILTGILLWIGLRFKESDKNVKQINGWWYVLFALFVSPITSIIAYYSTKNKPEKFQRGLLMCWLVFIIFFLASPLAADSNGLKIGLSLLATLIGVLLGYFFQPSWLSSLRLFIWSFAFILIGISTYFTTLIRSNSDPAVDMFNVDNPVSLVGYLSREQYGDWPILKGQDFTAKPTSQEPVDVYVKGKDKYEKKGKKYVTEYAPEDIHFFPRMWDNSNDQGHADYYASFAGIGKDQKTGEYYDKPTMSDNISFFVSYQFNWMYWRYFMWNFAGKQNDIQGIDMGNVRDGNWLTGISFWDNARLGDQSKMPDTIKHNKANNKLFCLPLILGILGLVYQYKKDKRDTLVTVLLFFFTGFAISIYLNQAGNQPRERDYAYVGSFYVFALWIGIGVLYVKELFEKFIKNNMAGYAAAGLCLLAVPVLMASQEWNDHDRSHKVLARDLATDYLQSCAPNAILITFGDNDTYPLWYAQEVQGVRRDVRVINSSLLGTDWYINQLRYKVNQSDPIDVLWTPEQIMGSKRDAIYYYPDAPGAKVDQSQPMDLYTMLKDYSGSDDPTRMAQNGEDYLNIFPTKKVKIPVDINLVKQNGTVNLNDSVVSEVLFDIPKSALGKNETAILNMIAANKWKRPIYFTSPYDELGFQSYLRTDGLTYRLVPVHSGEVNRDWAYNVMMNKFVFGNADKPGVYYDEENRRHLNTIRMQYAQAANNLAEHDRKDDAKRMLEKCDKMMLQENFPYGLVSRRQQQNQISGQFLLAAYKAGDTVLAKKVSDALRKDLEQQVTYFNSLDENKQGSLTYENQIVNQLLQQLQQMEQYFKTPLPINPEGGNPVINNVLNPQKDTQVHDKPQ